MGHTDNARRALFGHERWRVSGQHGDAWFEFVASDRAEVTAAERVRFVDGSVGIPSTITLPSAASTDNEAGRVYNNSVDNARKVLADACREHEAASPGPCQFPS
jgi:hypothetical protein